MKINLHFIEDTYKQSVAHSDQILILDLFNIEVINYRPFILSQKQSLNVPLKTIIYHSHVQDDEVQHFIDEANLEFFEAEASQTFPIEI